MNRHIIDKNPYIVVSVPNKNLVRNKNNWHTSSFLGNNCILIHDKREFLMCLKLKDVQYCGL